MQFLKECCDIQGDCVICSFSVFDGTPWPLCEMAKTYAEIAIFWKNSKNRVPKLLFDCSEGHHPLALVSLMKTDAGIRRRS